MCCFTGPVVSVRRTSIFARLTGERQVLVYAMSVSASAELAMVLPVPTPPGSPEDSVRFLSLERYPGFFNDLESGFPETLVDTLTLGGASPAADLPVVSVGAYEASFAPAPHDFERLDPRFRLSASLWEQLPVYKDYGFAVFKLKPGEQRVHPMAFSFPTRLQGAIFFPTVHIHDGELREAAEFDHTLYAQMEGGMPWTSTEGPARSFMSDLSHGLLAPDAPCYRRFIQGTFANRDITFPGAEPEARAARRESPARATRPDSKRLVDAFLLNAVMEGAEEGGVEAGPDGCEVYTVIGGERCSFVTIPTAVHAEMLGRLKEMAGDSGSFKISIKGEVYPVKAEFRKTVLGEGVVLVFGRP